MSSLALFYEAYTLCAAVEFMKGKLGHGDRSYSPVEGLQSSDQINPQFLRETWLQSPDQINTLRVKVNSLWYKSWLLMVGQEGTQGEGG